MIEMGIGSQGASLMGACWDAAAHTDGIVSKPTILLDGYKLEENGIYVIRKQENSVKHLALKDINHYKVVNIPK